MGVLASQENSRSEPPASIAKLLSVSKMQVSLNVDSSRHRCIRTDHHSTVYYTLQIRSPSTVHVSECFWTALISPMQTRDNSTRLCCRTGLIYSHPPSAAMHGLDYMPNVLHRRLQKLQPPMEYIWHIIHTATAHRTWVVNSISL